MGLFDYVEAPYRTWQTKWQDADSGRFARADDDWSAGCDLSRFKLGTSVTHVVPDGRYAAIADDASGDLALVIVLSGILTTIEVL